jgi:glycosyltransferase involved in cell wall biosynthesis
MGGAEKHALELRRHLRERGFDAGLVAIARARSSAMTDAPGAEGAVLLDSRRLLASPVAWYRAWRALRRQSADIIFAINPACAVVVAGLRTLRLLRCRVVCIFHSSRLQRRERMTFAPFRWIAPRLDALVYVSEAQRRVWDSRGLRAPRAAVIVNGVDLHQFSPEAADRAVVRTGLGLDPGDFVVGIVAALRPEKRHQDLIAAVAALRAQGRAAKLIVVGDGPQRENLSDLAVRLGLQQVVIFAGDQLDVRPFILACDVCALCSDTETLPMAALEILALGVPLVASDVGAMSEIVRDGVNGFLYPAGEVARLTEHLANLSEPDVRGPLRRAARHSVGNFDAQRMVDAYEVLARSLTAAR